MSWLNSVKMPKKKGFSYDFSTLNHDGNTVLDLAISLVDVQCVVFLVEWCGGEISPSFIKKILTARDSDGNSLLHSAAIYDLDAAASVFLELGFPLDTENTTMDDFSDGGLPIHLAAMHGSTKTLQLILTVGQKIGVFYSLINSQKNPAQDTPLHLACRFNQKECVRLLLQAGAHRSLKNTHELTPEQIVKDEEIKAMFL